MYKGKADRSHFTPFGFIAALSLTSSLLKDFSLFSNQIQILIL